MSAYPAAPPPGDAPSPLQAQLQFWAIARASLDYVRDTIEITRGPGELLDALIITAALDANMAPVKRAPELQQAYGGAQVSAPDDLRRPVSVNAVAQSLNLPFETVRRRALKLAQAGLCVIGPQGMVVPNSLTTSAADVAAQRGRYERAGRFYKTLKALGVAPPPAASDGAPAQPMIKAANWALSEYVLRACADLIGLTGNIISSRVLLELALVGARPLPTETLVAQSGTQLGRPVRATALAASLKLPRETVRRHVVALEGLGFCRRETDGVVVAVPDAMKPRLVELARANQGNLQRLLGSLARAGAVIDWEG
ncbi:hypothetical protein [Caulobacter hibisci]|uniref:Uncharacterized protein n=1 Tax=Caulobacter hibisci TaxID=2035993 RepID=A0ABS0T200_9CAUL|nr:hypothetical protein [Caulobacter hibisci]MBI1685909.1 hypothetical protein [Caulobacter hibisci]